MGIVGKVEKRKRWDLVNFGNSEDIGNGGIDRNSWNNGNKIHDKYTVKSQFELFRNLHILLNIFYQKFVVLKCSTTFVSTWHLVALIYFITTFCGK